MALRNWMASVLLAGLGFMLIGCASSGRIAGVTPSPASSVLPASPGASVTPQTPVANEPTPTAQVNTQRCKPGLDAIKLGDLAMDKPTVLYGFNADYMLPDSLSTSKPLTVTIQDNLGRVFGDQQIVSLPVVQPMSFLLDVCNTSTATTHHLTSIGVTLTSLTPYSGQLNALNACAFLYAHTGGFGGECASGYTPDVEVSLAFPTNAMPQATVTQALPDPIALAPGQSLGVSVGINPPGATAITTYRLGLGIDGQPVTYPSALTTQPTVHAPIARHWAGEYCNTAQMQSQIPASSPVGTYYVCPQV